MAITAVVALAASFLVASQAANGGPNWVAGENVASDSFTRTSVAGWGQADKGGAYTHSASKYFIGDGGAGVAVPPRSGSSLTATLPAVSALDVGAATTVSIPSLPTAGNGVYAGVQVRVSGTNYYQANIRVLPSGKVTLNVHRVIGSTTAQVTLARDVTAIDHVDPATPVRLEFQVTGVNPVTLQARAFVASSDAPSWQVEVEDATPARIQAAGAAGLWAYISGATPPLAVSFDDLAVNTLVPASSEPEATVPPVEPVPGEETPTGDFERVVAGSAPIGSTNYAVPANAIYVAPTGDSTPTGLAADPYATLQAAVSKAPAGATIVLRAGRYHESVIIPQNRKLTIQPYPNEEVWLDGSRVVTNWTASGATWVSTGWTTRFDASPTYFRGKPDNTAVGWSFINPNYPMASHPDQLWVDGTALAQVGSAAQVSGNTFFVDEANSRLIIGVNPAGHEVRSADLVKALVIAGANSTVRGIGIERYSPSVPDMGAVQIAATGVTLENVSITDCATTGLSVFTTGSSITDVTLARNGMLGGHASYADGMKVTGLLSEDNNTEHFNRAPVSGGLKIHKSRGVTVTDSVFRGNLGNQLWFDESNYDMKIEGNDILDGTGYGLVLELSATATVANNLIAGNDQDGILITDTGQVKVWNNTIVDNAKSVNIVQDSRRASNLTAAGHDSRQALPDPTVTWITANIVVSNNVLSESSGKCILCVEDYSHERSAAQMNVTSNGNVYQRPSATQPTWAVVWSRGVGNPQVFTTVAAFTAATGQDATSYAVDGVPVLVNRVQLTTAVADLTETIAQPLPTAVATLTGQPAGTRHVGVFL